MVCRFITIQIKAPMSQFTDLQIDCKVYMERQKNKNSPRDIEVEEQSQRTDTLSQDLQATVIKKCGAGKSRDR